jgi:hypothetical protein
VVGTPLLSVVLFFVGPPLVVALLVVALLVVALRPGVVEGRGLRLRRRSSLRESDEERPAPVERWPPVERPAPVEREAPPEREAPVEREARLPRAELVREELDDDVLRWPPAAAADAFPPVGRA